MLAIAMYPSLCQELRIGLTPTYSAQAVMEKLIGMIWAKGLFSLQIRSEALRYVTTLIPLITYRNRISQLRIILADSFANKISKIEENFFPYRHVAHIIES
jgi:hypothetical protein